MTHDPHGTMQAINEYKAAVFNYMHPNERIWAIIADKHGLNDADYMLGWRQLLTRYHK